MAPKSIALNVFAGNAGAGMFGGANELADSADRTGEAAKAAGSNIEIAGFINN